MHLGQCDLTWQCARKILGTKKLIGLSIENKKQALQCKMAGVDYFGVGPIFHTHSKNNTAAPIGCIELKKITTILQPKPIIAIGGIKLNNLKQILDAPVCGVALIEGILKQSNPYLCAKHYRKILNEKIPYCS